MKILNDSKGNVDGTIVLTKADVSYILNWCSEFSYNFRRLTPKEELLEGQLLAFYTLLSEQEETYEVDD